MPALFPGDALSRNEPDIRTLRRPSMHHRERIHNEIELEPEEKTLKPMEGGSDPGTISISPKIIPLRSGRRTNMINKKIEALAKEFNTVADRHDKAIQKLTEAKARSEEHTSELQSRE